MRLHLLSLALFSISSAYAQPLVAAHDGSLLDSNLRFVGRWQTNEAGAVGSNWGGAYLRARFTGTSVAAAANSTAGGRAMMVSLDGETPREIESLDIHNLATGEHSLLLGAPNQNAEMAFRGLKLDAGATTLPLAPRPFIEFVGDSITTGGGQTRPGTVNYAWQTAETLGADHAQIAFSGRALTTGFGCARDKAALDTRYFARANFNHQGDQTPWDFAVKPDIVVINLGQNDQCGSEPAATFEASYADFLAKIRARLPAARIVALRPFGGAYGENVRAAVASRRATGDEQTYFVDTLGWLDPAETVDEIHPTQLGHDVIAQLLAAQLKPLLAARN